jgi:hypothetical protein
VQGAGPCLGSLGLGGMWSVVGGRGPVRTYMVRTVLDAGGWSTPLKWESPTKWTPAGGYEAPYVYGQTVSLVSLGVTV